MMTVDVLDRLTSGPGGSYTYGAWATHLHAVTGIGAAYTASYDAAGDMLCRAPSSGTTCSSTPTTGAPFTYDAEGRLAGWQSAPGSSTTTSELADAQDQRVEERTATQGFPGSSGIRFIGGESQPVASYAWQPDQAAVSTDYAASAQGGGVVAVWTGGKTLSYLGQDGLGSTTVALSTTGTVTGSRLYTPYGAVRYSSGSLPTDYGYTGQRQDTTTGLEDDGARQYDTSAGQFASADTVSDGLNRYGYVHGNPETHIDPTGHRMDCGTDCNDGGGGGSGSTCGSTCPPVCHINCDHHGGTCQSNCNPPPTPPAIRTQKIHITALKVQLPWYDAMYAGEWIWAGIQILAGAVLIGAAIIGVATSAVALVTFANGLDLIIHGITTIIRILDGGDSNTYHIWVAISALADLLVLTADVVVAAVLTGGLGAEAAMEAEAPLLENSEALTLVGTFLGFDLKAAWDDFTELFSFKNVNN